MSDFSIEYILNRAGEKYSGTNGSLGVIKREKLHRHQPYVVNFSGQDRQIELLQQLQQQQQQQQQLLQSQQQQFLEQIPVLDWLQYTRYHPPKLQSMLSD